MSKPRSAWWPSALALVASVAGLVFASLSTWDYAQHLDRQIHDVHCSFIPGMPPEKAAENACKVAMYSPYAAILRSTYWGGIPVALFAVGAFAFFTAFSAYALFGGWERPRRASQFLAGVSLTPVAASAVMAFLSATRLHHFCKTCVGIYASSALLAVAAFAMVLVEGRELRAALAAVRGDAPRAGAGGVPATLVDAALDDTPPPRAPGGFLLVPTWLLVLGLCAATPALVYASALPSYASHVNACGKLEQPKADPGVLIHAAPAGATQPATLFVDPLCPTCKALHQRLVAEGMYDGLDTTLVLFPLDSECNWMIDRPLHPGSCMVSKAILCAGDAKARAVLEWAYDNQEQLLSLAKGGDAAGARAMVKARFPEVDACIDTKETSQRLTKVLRYIVKNHLPVSTPQIYIGETRLCDEDTDMGLPYAMGKLAPGLVAAK
jgi:uncharacterized membrane protein